MVLSFCREGRFVYQLCQKLCHPLPQLCQPPFPQLCQPPLPQLCQPPFPQPPLRQPTPPPTFNQSASINLAPEFA